MREQSHIDAMREAVRGDLERARSRRSSIFERPAPPPVMAAAPGPVAEDPEPAPPPELPPAAVAPPSGQKRRARFAFWRR